MAEEYDLAQLQRAFAVRPLVDLRFVISKEEVIVPPQSRLMKRTSEAARIILPNGICAVHLYPPDTQNYLRQVFRKTQVLVPCDFRYCIENFREEPLNAIILEMFSPVHLGKIAESLR